MIRVAACAMLLVCLPSCGPKDDAPESAVQDVSPVVGEQAASPAAEPANVIDASTREALEAIGYAAGTEEKPEHTGVIKYDPQRAQPGYNLYVSGHAPFAYLADMEGRVLHTWFYDAQALYPVEQAKNYFRRVQLCDNGDLFALVNLYGVIKLNSKSELLWHSDAAELLHHDLYQDEDGTLFTIGRNVAPIPEVHPETNVLDDTIVVYDREGHRIKRFSIYDAFRGTEWQDAITNKIKMVLQMADPNSRIPFEGFHTNTIEIFDGSLAGISPLLARGNAVLSSPIHGNVFIVDLEQERVVWNWFGPWERGIHQPTFLPNGHWLLFSNGHRFNGPQDAASAVQEFTFPNPQLVWEYAGTPENGEFYSRFSSLAERLPNGNTLIVSSDEGHAFEITPDKEIVWDFYNSNSVTPDAQGDVEIIGTLFQLERIPMEFCDRWLPKAAQ